MEPTELAGLMTFLRSTERLKDTLRNAHTSTGRRESVAEHTWRLTLMVLVCREAFPEIDFAKLVSICIVHDLGEALGGDIPAREQIDGSSKAAQERADLCRLLEPLAEPLRTRLLTLWEEYEAASTPEARLAKAFDKLETIMQHNQGRNAVGFDYRFNLEYGRRYTTEPPFIAAIRDLLDQETRELAESASTDPEVGRMPAEVALRQEVENRRSP